MVAAAANNAAAAINAVKAAMAAAAAGRPLPPMPSAPKPPAITIKDTPGTMAGKTAFGCLTADMQACSGAPKSVSMGSLPMMDSQKSAQAVGIDVMTQSFDQTPSRHNSNISHAGKPKAQIELQQQTEETNVLNTILLIL